jgi:NAD+ kinase
LQELTSRKLIRGAGQIEKLKARRKKQWSETVVQPTVKLAKALVVAKYDPARISSLLKENGFQISEKKPDFVVCYGGDGTILYAERNFPEVPKLIVKKSAICRKCDYSIAETASVLRKIKNGEYRIQEETKLEAEFKKSRIVGLNEIQVITQLPIRAIRFSFSYDGNFFDNLIGDGVIVATPFGSTGYYKATGGRPFKTGIGISFNNLHNKTIRGFVVSEETSSQVTINRGPAFALADNNEKFLQMRRDDTIRIKQSKERARFIQVRGR